MPDFSALLLLEIKCHTGYNWSYEQTHMDSFGNSGRFGLVFMVFI